LITRGGAAGLLAVAVDAAVDLGRHAIIVEVGGVLVVEGVVDVGGAALLDRDVLGEGGLLLGVEFGGVLAQAHERAAVHRLGDTLRSLGFEFGTFSGG